MTGIACQGKTLRKKNNFLVLVLLFAYYSAQGVLKQTCFCFRSYTKKLAITFEEKECPLIQTLCMRPCKIWAPYGGHCVEKSQAPKSKYVDTPNQAQ